MDKDAFRTLFVLLTVNMTEEDISRLLKVSRPTIHRYGDGITAPHHLGRLPAIKNLIKFNRGEL